MPRRRNQHRLQTDARLDVIKVVIEDVNLDATPYPLAQGREIYSGGIVDIDLSHGQGGIFVDPEVGDIWWCKRMTGRWMLDHIVDSDRGNSANIGGGSRAFAFFTGT